MTPAELLAALKALEYAIKKHIEPATEDVQELMSQTGADRYRTKLGPVYLISGSPKIVFQEDQLLAFAEAYGVDAVEKTVRPTFRDLFKIEGEDVIYVPTGEAVEFAYVRQGTKSVGTRLTREAKDRAQDLLAELGDAERSTSIMAELAGVDHGEDQARESQTH